MAKWIKAISRIPFHSYGNAYRSCSNCGEAQYMPLRFRYCSVCGERMDRPSSYNYNDFLDEDYSFAEEEKTYVIAYLFDNNTWVFSKQRKFAYIYESFYDIGIWNTEEDAYDFFVNHKENFRSITKDISGNELPNVLYKGNYKNVFINKGV